MLVLHCTHACIHDTMQVDLAGNLDQSDEAGKRELAFMANLLEERNFFLQKEAASSHPEPMASSLYSGDIETLICEAKNQASLLLRVCWRGAIIMSVCLLCVCFGSGYSFCSPSTHA
jgi:hypothetical protein